MMRLRPPVVVTAFSGIPIRFRDNQGLVMRSVGSQPVLSTRVCGRQQCQTFHLRLQGIRHAVRLAIVKMLHRYSVR